MPTEAFDGDHVPLDGHNTGPRAHPFHHSMHPIRQVIVLGPKLVAVTLIASVLLLGAPIWMSATLSAASAPAGCHGHRQPAAPDPKPAPHYCCEVGHSPATLPTSTSSPEVFVQAIQVVVFQANEPQLFEPLSRSFLLRGASPPMSPLRI